MRVFACVCVCVYICVKSHPLILSNSSPLVSGRQSDKAGARLALTRGGQREGKEEVGASRGVCVWVCPCVDVHVWM